MRTIVYDHIRKQGDTGDPLQITLSDANGPYPIPDTATVVFTMRNMTGTDPDFVGGGTAVADADQDTNPGLCAYAWQESDVASAGSFNFEAKVILPDLTEIRFPRDQSTPYGTLLIQPNLEN